MRRLALAFSILRPAVSMTRYRIAVIPVGNSPLVAWARTSKDSPGTAAFFAMFETMLKSVRFR